MGVKIYHNPRCSKSRQALQILHENGIETEIVEYMKTPLQEKELAGIINLLGITPRQLLRKNEDAYRINNLADESISDKQIIEKMLINPSLIERPIVVVDNKKAIIGRPPGNVLEVIKAN